MSRHDLGNLSLFFVPAGVGVVAHLERVRSNGHRSVAVSTALAIARKGRGLSRRGALDGRGGDRPALIWSYLPARAAAVADGDMAALLAGRTASFAA